MGGLKKSLKEKNSNFFWGEMAPCDHVVQIYEDDEVFLDTLAGFVGAGINSGDCILVIATPIHLKGLEGRLRSHAVNVEMLIAEEQYIPLDAETCLAKFMIDGWPDETLFFQFVSDLLYTARKKQRQVRAFGEMVALLWEQGHSGATVRLEHLWTKLCDSEEFCLFCAYPKTGFTQDAANSLKDICSAHSKVVCSEPQAL